VTSQNFQNDISGSIVKLFYLVSGFSQMTVICLSQGTPGTVATFYRWGE